VLGRGGRQVTHLDCIAGVSSGHIHKNFCSISCARCSCSLAGQPGQVPCVSAGRRQSKRRRRRRRWKEWRKGKGQDGGGKGGGWRGVAGTFQGGRDHGLRAPPRRLSASRPDCLEAVELGVLEDLVVGESVFNC
jgi:hypothetical protein